MADKLKGQHKKKIYRLYVRLRIYLLTYRQQTLLLPNNDTIFVITCYFITWNDSSFHTTNNIYSINMFLIQRSLLQAKSQSTFCDTDTKKYNTCNM